MERRREELAHRELVGAYTTTAVKNHSMNPPQDWATPLEFMPSHREAKHREPVLTEEQLEAVSDYNLRVAELAARLKANANG